MGLRGPISQSASIRALRGNPGRRPVSSAVGVHPTVSIPNPPDWLSADALAEWHRITGELADLALVANIDLASLATYCQTWGDLCALQRAWDGLRRQVTAESGGDADAATLNMHVITQPSGAQRPSILYTRLRELRSDLDRMARNFGANAGARARVQASSDSGPADDDTTDDRQSAQIRSFAHFR